MVGWVSIHHWTIGTSYSVYGPGTTGKERFMHGDIDNSCGLERVVDRFGLAGQLNPAGWVRQAGRSSMHPVHVPQN